MSLTNCALLVDPHDEDAADERRRQRVDDRLRQHARRHARLAEDHTLSPDERADHAAHADRLLLQLGEADE